MKTINNIYENGEEIETMICKECPDATLNCEYNKYTCERFCDKISKERLNRLEEKF